MNHLVTVSGEKIALDPNRSYVLGRGRDCSIPTPDIACSRRHAKIIVGGGRDAIFVEDLESRNGTFVNGDRIRGRVKLGDNDRVRIGTTVYLVRTSDEPAPSGGSRMEETGTMGFETLLVGDGLDEGVMRVVKRRVPKSTEFAGQLASFSLVEILQLVTQLRRAGQLNLALPDGAAFVEIRQGEVVAAQYGERRGFRALVELGKKRQGLFWLVETTAPCERNVHETSARLLVELCRAIDESMQGSASGG